MSLLDSFTKHSSESYTKTINYTSKLPSGATVASATISAAVDMTNGENVASGASAIVGSPTVTTTSVSIPFQNGTDGHTYSIAVESTLSNSNVLVDLLEMTVEDRPRD